MTFEFDSEVNCSKCQGSGEVERDGSRWDESGPIPEIDMCPTCEGRGTYTVHMRPIDLGDLDEMDR